MSVLLVTSVLIIQASTTVGYIQEHKTACDFNYMNLSCTHYFQPHVLNIGFVNYGRKLNDKKECPVGTSIPNYNCIAFGSGHKVVALCQDKPSCYFQVNSVLFGGDPCPGTDKYLEVHYSCRKCNSTTFGQDCDYRCSCVKANTLTCDKVSRTCDCKPGYHGANCDEECSATTYGKYCANTCNCVAENSADCDDVDGTCTCKPGFLGSRCEAECSDGTYGQNCANKCSFGCENSAACDKVDGTCTCQPGFYGSDCESECSATTYGQDCLNKCSCVAENTADCDKVDGTCTCKPGFLGSRCEAECRATTYGVNCANTCSCVGANSIDHDCDKVDGSCNCKPGFYGRDCDSESEDEEKAGAKTKPGGAGRRRFMSDEDIWIAFLVVGFLLLMSSALLVSCVKGRQRSRIPEGNTLAHEGTNGQESTSVLSPKNGTGSSSLYVSELESN